MEDDAAALAVVDEEAVDAGFEADFAAEGDDFLAEVADDFDEAVGADVGFGFDEDVFGGTGGDHFFEEPGDAVLTVADLGVEFAVGEGAGAAFAELDVGFGVEGPAAAPEAGDIAGAVAGGFAALEEDGFAAGAGEEEGAEEAAGAGADDEGARGGGAAGDGRWKMGDR